MHTKSSDGEYSAFEVVKMAKDNDLDIIAITDHNNTDSIDEAKKAGEILGVKVLPGIELSTRYNGKKIHILGYFFSDVYNEEEFQNSLRLIRNHDIDGLKDFLLGKVSVKKDVERNRIDVTTGIEILRYFGAIVILAHPIKIKKYLLDEILKLNFHGIEAKYFKNTYEETEKFIKIAEENNWIYTAGSDFHTDKKVDKRHGIIGEVFLTESEIEKFIAYKEIANIGTC
ncbi:PHP domain-containing protein [Clostridium carnis]